MTRLIRTFYQTIANQPDARAAFTNAPASLTKTELESLFARELGRN